MLVPLVITGATIAWWIAKNAMGRAHVPLAAHPLASWDPEADRPSRLVHDANLQKWGWVMRRLRNRRYDSHTATCLMVVAVVQNRVRIAHHLLEQYHANPNGLGEGTMPPLVVAVTGGQYDMTRLLLTYGAHPDRSTPDGSTPLFIAARFGRLRMARLLLRHGADPNLASMGRNGYAWWTPLHGAMMADRLHMVHLLLEWGAEVTPDVLRAAEVMERTQMANDMALYSGAHGECGALKAFKDIGF